MTPKPTKIYTDASLTQRCYLIDAKPRELSVQSIADHTVNEAEYIAIIHALIRAKKRGLKDVLILSDSQLAIRQLNGQYRIKEARLLTLAKRAWEAVDGMQVEFKYIPRGKNKAGLVLEGKSGML